MLIVGGGPAGLASAIAARAKGLRVTLVDFRTPPIDKACGEGLLPEGVAALRRLGVDPSAASPIPFAGIRFSDEHSTVIARFPRESAIGLRRTALHKLLVARALDVGVSMMWGARVSGLDRESATIDGHRVRFGWLIGADGQQSSVRLLAGLGRTLRGPARFGFRRHYAIVPWSNLVEVYWGNDCQLLVTPTANEEVCVSAFSRSQHLRIDRALYEFQEVAQRLRNAAAVSTQAGAITSLGRAPGVTRGPIALVGDASGTVDGIAGQGLSLALQQAEALGDALGCGDLARYESAHRRIMHKGARMTRLLLLMSASALIRRKALRLFASRQSIFSNLISIHAGQSSTDTLGAAQIVGLGWRVLCA